MYSYQEYPRTLHRPDGSTCTVRTDEAKAAAVAEGWSLTPAVDLTGNRFEGPAWNRFEAPAEAPPAVVDDAPLDTPKVKRKKAAV